MVEYQQRSAMIVWVLFAAVFVPIGVYMLIEFVTRCGGLGAACWEIPRIRDFTG
jgi:hypothetical protein